MPEQKTDHIEEGDIIALGQHRLLYGDALSYSNIKKLLNKKKAAMLFTDPPYNIDYVPEDRPIGGRARSKTPLGGIQNDKEFDYGKFLKLLELDIIEGAVYICGSTNTYCQIYEWMMKIFGREPTVIVWHKNNHSIGRRHYHRKHEFIFYNWFKEFRWCGSRNQVDVWTMKRRNPTHYIHPTQKPIRLVQKAILNSSNEGDAILDLFMGSGTTLMASEASRRVCYGAEIDKNYIRLIIQRWENYTRKKAEMIS